MRISREIGVYKKEHNMPILQSPRYSEILEKRSNMGEQMELNTDFVKEMLKENGLTDKVKVTSLFAPEPEKCLEILDK